MLPTARRRHAAAAAAADSSTPAPHGRGFLAYVFIVTCVTAYALNVLLPSPVLDALEARAGIDIDTATATEAATVAMAPIADSSSTAAAADNPLLLAVWDTPYGAPPFEAVKEAHYAPAFDEGMRRHDVEIAAVAAQTDAPTFANTIVALEESGATLERVASVFFNVAGTDTTERMQAIKTEYAPKLSMHGSKVYTNAALFARVKAVYDARDSLALNAEDTMLLKRYWRSFVRAGAALDDAGKARLTEINARLSVLYATFGDNIRKENAAYALHIPADRTEDLAGLPDAVIAAAKATALQRSKRGKESAPAAGGDTADAPAASASAADADVGYSFTCVRSSFTPFMQYADNRALRKEMLRAYTTRGTHGDGNDTRALIKEIVVLRAERAELLGFTTHAHYQLDSNMAGTPERVHELLDTLWPRAVARALAERDSLTALLRADTGVADDELQPHDWWYYSEKDRVARYAMSQDELKPYFELSNVLQKGALAVATKLFGVEFVEVTDTVPRYHPEVRAFDVREGGEGGTHVGLLYVDYHPRDGKRGGAWMSEFRAQKRGERPIIVNVGNFPSGTPALMDWDSVTTIFHEFGHALHGLLSDVTYDSVAGTNVKRDYVEFPSQLLENWAGEKEVLAKYALHHESGAVIPDALVEKLRRAATFNKGFDYTELTAAALLDMAWHELTLEQARAVDDVAAFEAAAMARIGLPAVIAPRYRSPYFQHIFSGDGYSSGYYVYEWAQVLEADAFDAFKQTGDIFNPELARKLRTHVFNAGSSDEEMVLYKRFRGSLPDAAALLKREGLADAVDTVDT